MFRVHIALEMLQGQIPMDTLEDFLVTQNCFSVMAVCGDAEGGEGCQDWRF